MVLSTLAHIGGERAAAVRDQGATTVGNAIGNMLGTDAKGKADLSSALQRVDTSQSAQSAPSAAATGGLLTALGGALGGSNRVAPVDFKSLEQMLPASLPGMKRISAEGENQGALGVKTSSAKADYAATDGGRVQLEISDISGVSGLMDLANGLIQDTTSQSDTGYEKDVVLGGRTVHEKYDAPARKGELSVVVAKRFAVDLSGNGVDMNSLQESLGQIDLARLESMKDAGAQPK